MYSILLVESQPGGGRIVHKIYRQNDYINPEIKSGSLSSSCRLLILFISSKNLQKRKRNKINVHSSHVTGHMWIMWLVTWFTCESCDWSPGSHDFGHMIHVMIMWLVTWTLWWSCDRSRRSKDYNKLEFNFPAKNLFQWEREFDLVTWPSRDLVTWLFRPIRFEE